MEKYFYDLHKCLRNEPQNCCTLKYLDLQEYRTKVLRKPENPMQVIVSRSGNIPFDRPLFQKHGLNILIYTCKKHAVLESIKSQTLKANVSVIEIPEGEDGLCFITEDLKTSKGVNFMDVSCGGSVISSLIDSKLLDEIRYTVCGQIAGPLNHVGLERPLFFPNKRASYLHTNSPLICWKGIRYLL